MPAPRHTDGVGKAQARSTSSSSHDAPSLDAVIAGLADLDADQLRLQWRNHLGGTPPAGAVTTQRDERKKSAPRRIQAAASASRQVFIAAARNARCVRADVRWR
jgi:hypothetical protein